jgi:protein TonB
VSRLRRLVYFFSMLEFQQPTESYLQKERRLFRRAVWAAVFLHAGVLLGIMWAAGAEPVNPFQPLAVVDFAHFDPEGGEPGGGLDDDAAAEAAVAEPETQPEESADMQPEPEPTPEPEAEPEPETEPEIIESASEQADPLPPPPLPENKPPKPKPKPKPAPKQSGPQRTEAGAEGGKLPGGGPGQGQGGLGGGSGQGNPDEMKAYLARVRKRLTASKKYPPAARAQKLEGVATVSFLLAPDGRVLSSRLAKSSGHPALDEEVMALVRRVSPLPPRPKDLPQDNLSLTVPIQFSLR